MTTNFNVLFYWWSPRYLMPRISNGVNVKKLVNVTPHVAAGQDNLSLPWRAI